MKFTQQQINELEALTKKELIKRLETAYSTLNNYENVLQRERAEHNLVEQKLIKFQISCHLLQLRHNDEYARIVANEVEVNTKIDEFSNFALPF